MRPPNVGLMLARRLRRRPNIKPALGQRVWIVCLGCHGVSQYLYCGRPGLYTDNMDRVQRTRILAR